jgi:hypothetical protein
LRAGDDHIDSERVFSIGNALNELTVSTIEITSGIRAAPP